MLAVHFGIVMGEGHETLALGSCLWTRSTSPAASTLSTNSKSIFRKVALVFLSRAPIEITKNDDLLFLLQQLPDLDHDSVDFKKDSRPEMNNKEMHAVGPAMKVTMVATLLIAFDDLYGLS